jgi:fibrillarin-like pre-rRNA processing protein
VIWIGNTLVSDGEAGVYSERILSGKRVWDPYRSKLAALYHLGKGVELTGSMRVLYLGAAHGTTVSQVSDYADVVYAVEKAPFPMQDSWRSRGGGGISSPSWPMPPTLKRMPRSSKRWI